MNWKKTHVSTKYQVVIPKEIRKSMNIQPHDDLIIYYQGNNIVITKAKPSIKDLKGTGSFTSDYLKNERLAW